LIRFSIAILIHTDIIHGDIKPQNVLINIASPGSDPIAKVTDFGFSCYGHGEGAIVHPPRSPHWHAPEWHERGFTINNAKRMDIYSYGLLFAWICLGGSVSPQDIVSATPGELESTIGRMHEDELLDNSELQQLFGRVRWLFERTLRADPANREENIRDLLKGFINPLLPPEE